MAERSLAGASIVVTGASGGLGGCIARQLADDGARLTMVARDSGKLESLGIDAVTVAADLRDAETGRRIVAAAVAANDRLDGVVNAAGVVAFGSLADTDDEVIEDLFLTNVLGPLWLMRAAIPALTETRGFIANISAVVAEQPLAGMAAYAASKAALTAAAFRRNQRHGREASPHRNRACRPSHLRHRTAPERRPATRRRGPPNRRGHHRRRTRDPRRGVLSALSAGQLSISVNSCR